MQLIQPQAIQTRIDDFVSEDLYIHLELTTGLMPVISTAPVRQARRSSAMR